MRLDTVAFDLDEFELRLVWRGRIPIEDVAGSNVGKVCVVRELLSDAAMTLEQAERALFVN